MLDLGGFGGSYLASDLQVSDRLLLNLLLLGDVHFATVYRRLGRFRCGLDAFDLGSRLGCGVDDLLLFTVCS